MQHKPIKISVPKEVQAISFDIFDTLLVRPFKCPSDLFKLVEYQLTELYGESFRGFAEARIFAEQYVRLKKQDSLEVSLDEIYEKLNHKYPISYDLELQIEYDSCFPRKAMLDFYNRCKQDGFKIFIVSDMYLSSEFIAALLTKCGYVDWDLIFISNERQASKHEGNLFELVAKEAEEIYGIKRKQILHVGDNEFADYKQAICAGLSSNFIPKISDENTALWDRNIGFTGQFYSNVDLLWKSLCDGLMYIYNSERDISPSQLAGFEVSGPVACGLAMYIKSIADIHEISNIVFFARDGLIVKKMFDILYHDDIENGKYQTHYLFVSRRCLYIAGLQNPLSEDNIAYLTRTFENLPVKKYLERIGLNPAMAEISKIAQKYFSNLDEILIYGAETQERLKPMIRELGHYILEATTEERISFANYLKRFSFENKSIVIDLGWHASMQSALMSLLGSNNIPYTLVGVYLGLLDQTMADMKICAYDYVKGFDERLEQLGLIESLFCEPDGSVICVREREQNHTFYANRSELDHSTRLIFKEIHQGAEDFAHMFKNLYPKYKFPLNGTFLRMLLDRYLQYPTRSEAESIGRVLHSSDFSHTTGRTLVNNENIERDGVLRAYENSIWKAGFFALLSEEQRNELVILLGHSEAMNKGPQCNIHGGIKYYGIELFKAINRRLRRDLCKIIKGGPA